MPKILRRLKLHECSLVDRPANQHAAILLWKRHADPAEEGDPVMPLDIDRQLLVDLEQQIGDLTKQNADLSKGKEEAETEAAKALAELDRVRKGKAPSHDGESEEDAILKGMSEPVRELVAQIKKQNAEYEARLAKQEERSEIEDCEKKISKRFPHIGRAAHFAPSYYKLTKALAPDEVVLWDRLLGQASEALGRLGEEQGHSGMGAEYAGGDGGLSAWQSIEAKAREIQKRHPSLSDQQALARATEENPRLYDEYRKETM